MTEEEFQRAISAVSFALKATRRRKPKSVYHAARSYANGIGAKREHIEELSQMTVEQLLDMAYRLKAKRCTANITR